MSKFTETKDKYVNEHKKYKCLNVSYHISYINWKPTYSNSQKQRIGM